MKGAQGGAGAGDEFHSFEEDQIDTRVNKNAGGIEVLDYQDEEEKQGFRTSDPNEADDAIQTELDDVFHDANDFFPSESVLTPGQIARYTARQSARPNDLSTIAEDIEDMDPLERDVLPYFKDPKTKISIWTILKDSIGKDITKLSVPVYFNDPTNILQKCCFSQEYIGVLEQAVIEKDPIRRLGIVAVYSCTLLSNIERNSTKPFNPLLGETYEFVNDKMHFIAEQVSHHPPVTAFHAYGKGYKVWSNNKTKSKFNGKNLTFS